MPSIFAIFAIFAQFESYRKKITIFCVTEKTSNFSFSLNLNHEDWQCFNMILRFTLCELSLRYHEIPSYAIVFAMPSLKYHPMP